MSPTVGSIVRARDREWIVLPGSTGELVHVQPLGGNPHEVTAILPDVETIVDSTFDPPDPELSGDFQSAWLMRAAARIGNQNTTGPFRSLGRINVQPRPYQYVPLLMGLKQEPVRLLIADDVGIGKTVESLLIARELMDRGEIEGFCVLCPPHLAEQWQKEISEKFHIEAELYVAKTADRIHRQLAAGESPFERHPVMVASLDYLKQTTRRDTFLQHAPDFVIVDEAHTCTTSGPGKHLRHDLVQRLAKDRHRHVVFVTATPHTGDEDAFRNLLTMLNPELRELPDDLTGERNRRHREKLAAHMVQRRRGDLAKFLQDTPFPDLEVKEASFRIAGGAKDLLEEMVEATRKRHDEAGSKKEQRVTWWSLLSILRSFASSPPALAATLRQRNFVENAETEKEVEEKGFKEVLGEENDDTVTGAAEKGNPLFDEWAARADELGGAKDPKLKLLAAEVKGLLDGKRNVIVFCQFIETARYVAAWLEKKLDAAVECITGDMNTDDRSQRIRDLEAEPSRVLVATDCLSEGVNLQHVFDTVVHYDLHWNPTRHEQREGRVDRYGQKVDPVRSLLLYGINNVTDGIVLNVLLRKQNTIRTSTGVTVPVPENTSDVVEAIMESVVLRNRSPGTAQLNLKDFQAETEPFHADWEARAERTKAQRTLFAHTTIDSDAVAGEIRRAEESLAVDDVEGFVTKALQALQFGCTRDADAYRIALGHSTPDEQHALGITKDFRASFKPHVPGAEHLHRTHPIVQALCNYTIETAIDELLPGPAARSGAIIADVDEPVTILLARHRYSLRFKGRDRLVEEIRTYAWDGKELQTTGTDELLAKRPKGNLSPQERKNAVHRSVQALPDVMPALRAEAEKRSREAKRSHERVRDASKLGIAQITFEVNGEPDIIGVYSLLPGGQA